MKKSALALILALLASGCASVKPVPLDANAALAMKGQTVALTTRAAKPDFTAMTAGKATFAVVGALLMIKEGNDIVRDNEVQDPAASIGKALAKHLEQARGVGIVSPALNVTSGEPEQLVTAANGTAKYILDVNTVNWMFGYFPTDWTHYRVIYSAQARLIEADTKKVIASAFCQRVPESNTNAPTFDELVNNKAAGLKKELAIASEECVASLKKDMLAL